MTTLLLFLPPRSHLRAQGRSTAAVEGPGQGLRGPAPEGFDYLLSPDGLSITARGRLPAEQLPAADTVIAIPAESDVAWRRVKLPKAGRQMRPALAGLLEEQLLDEPDSLHFALEPEAVGGSEAWVAIVARAALLEPLGRLEAAQLSVDRIAPLAWPDDAPRGHFYAGGNAASPLALRWSHAQGVANLPLDGSLARQLLSPALLQGAQWSAEPAVAAQAEHWLGTAVTLQSGEQRALAALAGPWDLRQFELAPRARGIRALRQLYRGLMRPGWRPVRWGLAGLLLVQLLGLNLLAWQQSQTLQARRAALASTLSGSYPQVRAILDAPLQMRRETELLRAQAGRAGEQDLETLLAAAATAWPAERGPVETLSFEPGRLQLSAQGWSEPQLQQFRSQLRSEGWQLDLGEGRMTLSRATRGPSSL